MCAKEQINRLVVVTIAQAALNVINQPCDHSKCKMSRNYRNFIYVQPHDVSIYAVSQERERFMLIWYFFAISYKDSLYIILKYSSHFD